MSRTRERYARMMATFWRNPRVRKLTDAAIATYCLALSYACDQLNDGILTPDEALTMCARGKKGAIRELVNAGFWGERDGVYLIANYLEHNESRASLEASRERAIADGKRGGRPKGSGTKNQKGTLFENSNSTHTETETHVDGDGEPPLRVGDAEEPRSLSERVARQLDLTPTPGSVCRLLELLSALHSKPNGAPYAEPGMPSANDRKLLAGVISQAEKLGNLEDADPMRLIAGRWLALLALVANGDAPPIRNPLAYFAKAFDGLETTRSEAGASFPPARILEAAE
jgi:hypothetical protein